MRLLVGSGRTRTRTRTTTQAMELFPRVRTIASTWVFDKPVVGGSEYAGLDAFIKARRRAGNFTFTHAMVDDHGDFPRWPVKAAVNQEVGVGNPLDCVTVAPLHVRCTPAHGGSTCRQAGEIELDATHCLFNGRP